MFRSIVRHRGKMRLYGEQIGRWIPWESESASNWIESYFTRRRYCMATRVNRVEEHRSRSTFAELTARREHEVQIGLSNWTAFMWVSEIVSAPERTSSTYISLRLRFRISCTLVMGELAQHSQREIRGASQPISDRVQLELLRRGGPKMLQRIRWYGRSFGYGVFGDTFSRHQHRKHTASGEGRMKSRIAVSNRRVNDR